MKTCSGLGPRLQGVSEPVLSEGTSDNTCVCCDQLDDLLSLVAELKEEVKRLKSMRECKREFGWWSSTLALMKKQEQMEAPKEAGDPWNF